MRSRNTTISMLYIQKKQRQPISTLKKVVHHIGRKYHVTVVTSDGVEQVITMGQGGTRISSRDFLEEIEYTRKLIEEDNEKQRVSDRNYLFDHADEEFVGKMEKIRLGKNPEE